ncbi:unnamed protein product [Arabis nemorensis]|uniref:Uncharacterized protein n=1 Tax=Arabis nemorensis TaxID=586526 RepID=A0A565AUH8_9BRAS|nr:unnamed protein product [Arabis nemorensis]
MSPPDALGTAPSVVTPIEAARPTPLTSTPNILARPDQQVPTPSAAAGAGPSNLSSAETDHSNLRVWIRPIASGTGPTIAPAHGSRGSGPQLPPPPPRTGAPITLRSESIRFNTTADPARPDQTDTTEIRNILDSQIDITRRQESFTRNIAARMDQQQADFASQISELTRPNGQRSENGERRYLLPSTACSPSSKSPGLLHYPCITEDRRPFSMHPHRDETPYFYTSEHYKGNSSRAPQLHLYRISKGQGRCASTQWPSLHPPREEKLHIRAQVHHQARMHLLGPPSGQSK